MMEVGMRQTEVRIKDDADDGGGDEGSWRYEN